MNGLQLIHLLDGALGLLAEHRDELRDLDAAVGDGDLGITVAKGCDAARLKLAELGDAATPAQVLRVAGAAVAGANPSTFAALAGGGLMASARAVGEATDLGHAQASAMLRAAYENIATRGKAALGEKTVLDAMAPTLEVLEGEPLPAPEMLAAMVTAAARAVDETAALTSRRGRASWLGERSAGHRDPGSVAYLHLLEALADGWSSAAGPSGATSEAST